MSAEGRQQQFEGRIRKHSGILLDAKIARNFGFAISASVMEGGLFACTNNLV